MSNGKSTDKKSYGKKVIKKKRFPDLGADIIDKKVSLRIGHYFAESYEVVEGFYRGIYSFNGSKVIALDVVDEDSRTYLTRRIFYTDDVREVSFEGRDEKKYRRKR